MSRIEREKKVVAQMISIYCKKKHHSISGSLCEQCAEVQEYALARLDYCKFGEGKTSCRHCPVHCYKLEMRKRISEVMRFSGKRMIVYHPISAIRHLLEK